MSRRDVLQTRWTELRAFARVAPFVPLFRSGAPWNAAKLLELRARRNGDRPGILFEDQSYTWSEVDREVNRTARAFQEMGIARGDVVILLMDNRPEFLFAITALNRLRAAGALVNTSITGSALAHAIRIVSPVAILAGQEHRDKLESVLPELDALSKDQVWIQSESGATEAGAYRSFDELIGGKDSGPLADLSTPRADDRLGFIYTSGTTGLPKAAIVPNKRFLVPGAAIGRAVLELVPEDVVYISTPLYHSVGSWPFLPLSLYPGTSAFGNTSCNF